jgi:hypothetical protein
MNKTVQEAPQSFTFPTGNWQSFAGRLAVALSALKEDQYLTLSSVQRNRFVQFAGQGAAGLRVEAVCDAYLTEDDQLDDGQIAAMKAAGWRAPTHRGDADPQDKDPLGSPNFFVDFDAPVSFQQVADFAVRTLSETFEVPDPDELEYNAFEHGGGPLTFPDLCKERVQRSESALEPPVPLDQALLVTMRGITGIDDLEFDADGDISLRRGSQLIYVRILDKAQLIRIWSPLLWGVEESLALLGRLNRLNIGPGAVRFCFCEGVVFAETDADAGPLLPQHIGNSLRRFADATGGVNTLLQIEFGGRTSFIEPAPGELLH